MSDETYYQALAVLERIDDELLHQGMTRSKFSVKCGYKRPWWYRVYENVNFPTVRTLDKCAKALNVSIEYLLTGRNKAPYTPIEITFKRLIDIYDSGKYVRGCAIPKGLMVIIHKLKHKKANNMHLKTLLEFANILHANAYELMKG